jgi:hypothetical protein
MTEVNSRYAVGTTGPDPRAAALSQETNDAMKGWNDEAIDLAGKKAPDGKKTDLDIFNDALKGNPQDIKKAEDDMIKGGMSKEDADKAVGSYMHMKDVDTKHNQLAMDAGNAFENGLSPEQRQQYDALKQSGDKKAINEFENKAAQSNPDLNQAVLMKRQASGDVEYISRQMVEINQAGNDVEKLKAVENTTTGVAMSPTEEAAYKNGGTTPGTPTQPQGQPFFGSFVSWLQNMRGGDNGNMPGLPFLPPGTIPPPQA